VKDIKDLTILVADSGLFCDFAAKLSESVKRCIYYVPPDMGLPKINLSRIGYNLGNLELVTDLFEVSPKEIDMYAFLDVGFGSTAAFIESLGKPVWGSKEGEALELDRVWMKELLADEGMPVGRYEVLEGMKALREYLRKNDNVFVKCNRWRGTLESFFSKNYKEIETKLFELEHDLGAWSSVMEFIVEDELPDCIEFGTDLITCDGMYPKNFISGYEIKDSCYVGVFKAFADLPEPLTRWNTVMAPYLKEFRYRGALSNEIRIGKDLKPYMIDATCRLPSPPNELYQEFYTNIADMVWGAANGIMIEPEPIAKFGAQVIGASSFAEKNWQPVDFPAKLRKHVKMHNACKIGSRYYIIPQSYGLEEIVSVCGWGDTLEAAIEMVKDVAGQVTGYGLSFPCEKFDFAQKQLEEADAMGLGIF